MRWIDEQGLINKLKKSKQVKRASDSDLRRAEAALLTYQGENSTEYQKVYLLKTVEELLPLFIEEIRLLQKELQKQRRTAKTVAKIYDSMKNTRGSDKLEQILAHAIFKLSIGETDDAENKEEKS